MPDSQTEKADSPSSLPLNELSPATEAAPFGNSEDIAAANVPQELALAPGRIAVMRNWVWHDMDATAAALADWCRNNPAPDIKPSKSENAAYLGFLLTPTASCSVDGHPKHSDERGHDVAFTHGCSFDLDKVAGFDIAATLERTEKAGYAAVFWESHNSTEANPAGRLLVILDPPCPADKHAAVYEQLRSELCPLAPKGQHNANRGWNPPRAGAPVDENEGRPVDWRDVLARAPRAQKPEPRTTSAAPQAPAVIAPANMEFAIHLCQKHPPGTEDGNASANLVSLGCKLILGCGLDIETAVVTALRYYDPRCTNAAGEPYPWGEDEIRRAFTKSAGKEPSKAQEQWRSVLDEPEAIANDAGAPAAASGAEAQPQTIDEACSLLFRPVSELPKPKPLDYVCEGLLIARDVRPASIVCYPGVGKTTAGVELARAVSTGTPAFGQFPCKKGRVLYLANEGGRGVHGALLQHAPEVVLVRDTLVFSGDEATVQASKLILAKAAKEFDLIILDSLNSSLPGLDENDARSAQPLGDFERLLSAENGGMAAMVVLRHTGKSGQGGRKDPMQAGRGTSAIDGRVSVQWLLEPVGDLGVDRSVDWQCTRANDTDRAPARPFNVALRGSVFEVSQETGKQVAAKREAATKETRHQNDEQLARDAILEAWWTGGRRGISQRDAEQIALAKGLPGRVGRRALEQLVEEGQNPAGRGSQYAYRTTVRGPVLWGTNPHDKN
jgi:hypothetical protein